MLIFKVIEIEWSSRLIWLVVDLGTIYVGFVLVALSFSQPLSS